jgi:hypothetical protein
MPSLPRECRAPGITDAWIVAGHCATCHHIRQSEADQPIRVAPGYKPDGCENL